MAAGGAASAEALTNAPAAAAPDDQAWNWHLQNTDIVQGNAPFPARYSGPNSLGAGGQIRETLSLDLFGGVRLWRGAEAHLDALGWQGLGLSQTHGAEAFPSGEAYRLGATIPNVNAARVFVRQTFALGDAAAPLDDDALHLGGALPTERLTLTLGRMSAKDIFDNNAYANDPRTQFMNWAFVANEGWDYPADSLGYTTGLAAELNEPGWALRAGFFQVPRSMNGVALDGHYLEAFGSVAEAERQWALGERPGAVRVLAYLNRTDAGLYGEAAAGSAHPGDLRFSQAYRAKYGFGLNLEQMVAPDVGLFSRIGWSDGRTEAWMFSDVDSAASAGVSLGGALWSRPEDVLGVAGAVSALSAAHRRFFEAGGAGILSGDGTLSYGLETAIEAYYSLKLCRKASVTLDGQFINHPAMNRDRGPVAVFAARLHWEL